MRLRPTQINGTGASGELRTAHFFLLRAFPVPGWTQHQPHPLLVFLIANARLGLDLTLVESAQASFLIANGSRFALTRLLLHDETPNHKRIHARSEKRPNRICRRAHDWLASQVERSVHHHRDASAVAEFANQPPVERI